MTSLITTLILLLVGIVIVDGSSIKSCCIMLLSNIIITLPIRTPQEYTTSLTSVNKELQYKDIVILSLMEEDGSLFKGKKMALKIFINIGGNMRWDLAASQVSFGLV